MSSGAPARRPGRPARSSIVVVAALLLAPLTALPGSALGYDAGAVGDQELAAGFGALPGYRDRYGLIAQNLAFCTPQNCLIFSAAPLVLERAGETVGVFALLDAKMSTEAAKLVPAAITARALVRQLAERGAHWIVVLYHGPVREAPGIHASSWGTRESRCRPAKSAGR